jgi:hypothetical protein
MNSGGVKQTKPSRPPCFPAQRLGILAAMSFRKAGGAWEPMLLGIQARTCKVCGQGLYRNITFLRGGWSRCTVCDRFVHYSCLAAGATKFFKMRPRVCKLCREAQERSGAVLSAKPAVAS